MYKQVKKFLGAIECHRTYILDLSSTGKCVLCCFCTFFGIADDLFLPYNEDAHIL